MPLPTTTIQVWNGAPTIHVDGEPIASTAYFCTEPTPTRIASMRRSGVRLITWGVGGATAHASDMGWRGPGRYDYEHLDRAARVILEHHGDAWLLPRIATTAPAWWLAAHPEDNAVLASGQCRGLGVGESAQWCDEPRETVVSQASDRWQADCEAALAKLVEHLDRCDWGHRCIGLHPNGGENEWFPSHGHAYLDYGPLAVAAFRAWLRDQGVEGASSAEIPRPEDLECGSWGAWHDLEVSQRCQLWWRFYHGQNARRLTQTCAAVKRASDQRLLAGAFYGYIGDTYAAGRPTAWLYGHHHALGEVTGHPAVDFLAAPFNYINRQPGGTPESQIPTAHADLAGCFTFTENDLGTFWSVKDESPAAIARTRGTMIRDQGQRLIRRQGFWWMDLIRDQEWYTHPILEDLIGRLTGLQAEEAGQPASTWRPEIAVVLGNDTPFHFRTGYPVLAEWVTKPLRHVLPALGAPFDVLVLDDLGRANLPAYKLFVFLDVPCVDPDQRALVHRVLSARRAVAYFHGLPGLNDGKRLDIAHCSALTGMELRLFGGKPQAGVGNRMSARFTDFDHPLLAGVPPSTTLGGYPVESVAFVADQQARVLGTQHVKGRPAVAITTTAGGWTSVFSCLAGAPAIFFRNLARLAGAHLFTEIDAVVDACDNLILVHQIGPGPLSLTLHRPWAAAVDRLTNARWPAVDGRLHLEGPHGASHLLAAAP